MSDNKRIKMKIGPRKQKETTKQVAATLVPLHPTQWTCRRRAATKNPTQTYWSTVQIDKDHITERHFTTTSRESSNLTIAIKLTAAKSASLNRVGNKETK